MALSKTIIDDVIRENVIDLDDVYVNMYKDEIFNLKKTCDSLERDLLELKSCVNYVKPIVIDGIEETHNVGVKRRKREDEQEEIDQYNDMKTMARVLSWDQLADIVSEKNAFCDQN